MVGWYHSHPTFPTQPSTIDIYNQVLQQHHHRDEATGEEPYVAGGCPAAVPGGWRATGRLRRHSGTCTVVRRATVACPCPLWPAAIVGPYDKRLGSAQSSISWFYVQHAPGRLPAEGQRPNDVGCVAKALQTLQLVDDGGRAVAEIAAWPVCGLQQLAARYAQKTDAADMMGPWRDGSTRLQKLVASLQVRVCDGLWCA